MQKSILIVGGGTAGWMAANLFRKAWPAEKVKITLIESPTIGIIGVGEGSTPQLKSFMDTIGVDEQEWMSACDATYKLGIRFEDWSTRASKTSYFHPFPAQTDDFTLPDFMYNAQIVRKGIKVDGHPDRFFLAPRLVDEAKSPFASENFPFEVQYGYHFDSHKLGEFLKSLAILRGVDYQQCDVEQVLTDDSGITSIIDKDGHAYSADFYVDASGFNSLLLQKALGVGFVSFKSNLFNDSAVVLPTPRQSEIQPQTLSKALSAGWMWSIPLRSRTGNGYVYSSDYLTAEQAEAELRKELDMESSEIKARHIKMNVGRVERNWEKNCVAIGLSQGFIEPLEATALHLVYDTIAAFILS